MDETLAALDFAPDPTVTEGTPDVAWTLLWPDGDIHTVAVYGNTVLVTDTATGEEKLRDVHECDTCTPEQYARYRIGQLLSVNAVKVTSGPPVQPVAPDPEVRQLAMIMSIAEMIMRAQNGQ